MSPVYLISTWDHWMKSMGWESINILTANLISFSYDSDEAVDVLNRRMESVKCYKEAKKLKANPDKMEILLVAGQIA